MTGRKQVSLLFLLLCRIMMATGQTGVSACDLNGTFIGSSSAIFGDDCKEYFCSFGELSLTGKTDPYCCIASSGFESSTSGPYEKYRQHFLWYQYDRKWAAYNVDYNTALNDGKWVFGLNESRYDGNCRLKVCSARNRWEDTGETHVSCCEYKGVGYHHGKPLYKDDCIGYVCDQGEWLMTNYTDPKCCVNIESVDVGLPYWYDYYEYWWKDYDFYESLWNNGGNASDEWFRVNKTRIGYDCIEVKCVARNTWVPTGYVGENCTDVAGCEFNGQHYNHTDRLPGCMKVYCIDGNWLQRGYIDPDCRKCYARWDPHLGTFDGRYYSYHGTCSYALAQEGASYTPQYGVFSSFFNCWGAACMGPTTYTDSSGTVIEMGRDGRYAPELYTLYVNGVSYEIKNNIPQPVMEGSIVHPVMAWKNGYGCIRLLGSSRISVQKCASSLEIWVSTDFYNKLYGLCGLYDGNPNDDYTKRDGSLTISENDFADSWETTGNCFTNARGRKKREAANGENVCDTDNSTRDALYERCMEMAQTVGDNVTEEELAVMIGDCMFDLCTVYTNTSGDQDALDGLMGDIMVSAAEIVDAQVKTTDDDVLPEPLKDLSTTFVATTTYGTPPATSEQDTTTTGLQPAITDADDEATKDPVTVPPASDGPTPPHRPPIVFDDEKPAGSNCRDGICSVNVQVQVNIGHP